MGDERFDVALQRSRVGEDQYRCAHCRGVFRFAWSDEEAKDAARRAGTAPDGGEIMVVCEDCMLKLKRAGWAPD